MSLTFYRECLFTRLIVIGFFVFITSINCNSLYARVKFEPKVGAAVNYTDNIRLAPPGDEETQRVFEITPGFVLTADNQYLQALLDYEIKFLRYKTLEENNTYLSKVNGFIDTVLVPQVFFLNASVTQSHQNIDSDGPISINDFSLSENRTDVLTYTIRPYYKQQYGASASLLVRYAFEQSRYKNQLDDSEIPEAGGQNHRFLVQVSSGPKFQKGNWVAEYSLTQFEDTSTEERRFNAYQEVQLKGSYRLGSRFSGLATAGYEDGDATTGNSEGGFTGSLGASWNPNRRFFVGATYGRRFGDPSGTLLLEYSGRRSTLAMSYREDVTNSTGVNVDDDLNQFDVQQGSGGGTQGGTNSGGTSGGSNTGTGGDPNSGGSTGNNAFPDPTLQNDVTFPTLTNEVFVRRRFSGDFVYSTRRTSLGLYAFNELRDYKTINISDEEVIGATGTIFIKFGQSVFGSIEARWSRTDFNASDDSVDINRQRVDYVRVGEVALRKRLYAQTELKLAYSYVERDSTFIDPNPDNNPDSKDYAQNVITLSFDMLFDRL